MSREKDIYFMQCALDEARKAFENGDVPVGAVVVKDDKIIATGFNMKERCKNALKHAEIVAIEKAMEKMGDWRLNGCKLYVTCEPCIMCAGALLHVRISAVIFGVVEPKFGGVVSNARIFDIPYNHKVIYKYGFLEDEIVSLMKRFFDGLRKKVGFV